MACCCGPTSGGGTSLPILTGTGAPVTPPDLTTHLPIYRDVSTGQLYVWSGGTWSVVRAPIGWMIKSLLSGSLQPTDFITINRGGTPGNPDGGDYYVTTVQDLANAVGTLVGLTSVSAGSGIVVTATGSNYQVAIDPQGTATEIAGDSTALGILFGAATLGLLGDVNAPSPQPGDVLTWTGTQWEAQPPASPTLLMGICADCLSNALAAGLQPGDYFLDVSSTPPSLFQWDGTSLIGVADLPDIFICCNSQQVFVNCNGSFVDAWTVTDDVRHQVVAAVCATSEADAIAAGVGDGDFWLDTSVTPPVLMERTCNGSVPVTFSPVLVVCTNTNTIYVNNGGTLQTLIDLTAIRQNFHLTVATYSDLQALDTANLTSGSSAHVNGRAAPGDGGGGDFAWVPGDQSANVAGDPLQGIWVAPASDPTGASGAWRRIVPDNVVDALWWGADPTGVNDSLAAIHAARDYLWSIGGGILKVSGVIRTTDTINLGDGPAPIIIEGVDKYSTVVFGDFSGPDKSVINIGFSDNALRIAGNGVRRMTICSRGVVGDPVGISDERSFQAVIEEVFIPGDAGGDTVTVLGQPRKLMNTGIWATQVNNSDYSNCVIFSGYQPEAFTLSPTVRFNFSAGVPTITATEPVFTPDMVGEVIMFETSGGFFWATITAVNSSTDVTVDRAPTATHTNAIGGIGYVKVSGAAGSTTVTLSRPVATADWVGYAVHIPDCNANPVVAGAYGVLTARVTAVVDPTTIVLSHPLDIAVTDVPFIMAPAVFIGKPAWEAADNRINNDVSLRDMQIESFQGAGIVITTAVDFKASNIKLHGETTYNTLDFGRSMFAAVVSDSRDVSFIGGQLAYNWCPPYGIIYISGSYGSFSFTDMHVWGLLDNGYVVYASDTNANGLLVSAGNLAISIYGWQPQAPWQWFREPATYRRNFSQSGPIYIQTDTLGEYGGSPFVQASDVAALPGEVEIPQDSVYKIMPHGTYGTLILSSPNQGVGAVVKFRTALHAWGKDIVLLTGDALMAVTTAEPTGTTGTAGNVTVGLGDDGTVVIENRRPHAIRFNWQISGSGK